MCSFSSFGPASAAGGEPPVFSVSDIFMFIIDEYLKVIQETIDVVIFRFFSGNEEQQEK